MLCWGCIVVGIGSIAAGCSGNTNIPGSSFLGKIDGHKLYFMAFVLILCALGTGPNTFDSVNIFFRIED